MEGVGPDLDSEYIGPYILLKNPNPRTQSVVQEMDAILNAPLRDSRRVIVA